MKERDEHYILKLCDEALKRLASRQHRFDFLRGDSINEKRGRMLPVDAYYDDLNLVIEYRERQHSEPVVLFDKRMTVSGVPRGQQRAKYDARRRQLLPENGINIVELSYSDFAYRPNKRLKRNREEDALVILSKLEKYLKIEISFSH